MVRSASTWRTTATVVLFAFAAIPVLYLTIGVLLADRALADLPCEPQFILEGSEIDPRGHHLYSDEQVAESNRYVRCVDRGRELVPLSPDIHLIFVVFGNLFVAGPLFIIAWILAGTAPMNRLGWIVAGLFTAVTIAGWATQMASFETIQVYTVLTD